MNAAQVVGIFKALLQGPASRVELATRAGVNPKTVGSLLVELKAQKLIYVIGYTNESDGRNRVKIYALGEGEDAVPAATRPQRDRSRKNYVRKLEAANDATPKTTFAGGTPLWITPT